MEMSAIFLCSRVVKKQIECQDFTRKRTKCRAKLEKSVVSWSVNAMLFCVALLPLHETNAESSIGDRCEEAIPTFMDVCVG